MAEIFLSNEFETQLMELMERGDVQENGIPLELLEILVLDHRDSNMDGSGQGLLLSHRAPEPDGHEVFIDWDLAWHYRVFAWIDRLGMKGDSYAHSDGKANTLNSWFDQQVPSMSVEQRARTARMLLCWDALFVRSNYTADGGNSRVLGTIVSKVASKTLRLKGDWKISIAVLIAIAIRFSQSQLGAPIVWEAFGAAYTDHQLRNLWSQLLQVEDWRPVLELSIEIITFLIRNQHTLAIQLQEYGEAGLNRCLEGLSKPEFGLEQKDLLDALLVFSVIAEMRNRNVLEGKSIGLMPKDPKDSQSDPTKSGGMDLRCVGVLPRDPGKSAQETGKNALLRSSYSLQDFLDKILGFDILPISAGEGSKTWVLNLPLNISRERLDKFKTLVEGMNKSDINEPTLFAFDRNLLREIPDIFEYCILKTVSASGHKKKSVFEALFKTDRISIPSLPFLHSKPAGETACEVRLGSRITAHALLFPRQYPDNLETNLEPDSERWKTFVDGRIEKIHTAEREKDSVGADTLLEELYHTSMKWLKLKEDALEDSCTYIPFPLVTRLLDVIARLKKPECASVEIYFDHEKPPVYIYFPGRLRPDSKLGGIICNYVHSVILNRAMTKGYEHCNLSYAGLDPDNPVAGYIPAEGNGEPLKNWAEQVSDWKHALDAAYEENAYWIYSDKYVRDYHNWRRSVEMPSHTGDLDSLPSIQKTQHRFDIFRLWSQSPKTALAPDQVVLLGIDIGATLIKLQFYRYERVDHKTEFRPCCEVWSISRPKCDQDLSMKTDSTHMTRDERVEQLKKIADVFAKKLVASIIRVVYYDTKLYSLFQKGGKDFGPAVLAAAGVAWPGAVRANRIVGTSKILEDFPPLQRSIEGNRIEDLLALDIAGALKRAFESAPLFRGRVSAEEKLDDLIERLSAPVVMLVNDGLAEGFGRSALLNDEDMNGGAMAVVKVGSGLATSVFSDGRPEPGIWEGGKIKLDLGANPNPHWLLGDASSSVSKRFMPEYIKRTLRGLLIETGRDKEKYNVDRFNLDRLDSQEISTFVSAPYPDSIRPMTTEFGLRDLAFYKDIDVQILRRVHEKEGNAEPEWQTRVARLIGIAGNVGIEEFRKRVMDDGCTRISEVLGVTPQSVKHIYGHLEKSPGHYLGMLGEQNDVADAEDAMVVFAKKLAKPSVEALGRRLGDLIVTLRDLHGVKRVLITGGVLSGDARSYVIDSAKMRLKFYGMKLAEDRDKLYLYRIEERKSEPVGERNKDDSGSETPERPEEQASEEKAHTLKRDQTPKFPLDSGPYGAAIAALGAFLMEQQRKGYEGISALIHRLEANRKLIVSKGTAEHGDLVKTDKDEDEKNGLWIELSSHALTFDDAREHIEKKAVELQVYLSATDESSTTYVRWPYS